MCTTKVFEREIVRTVKIGKDLLPYPFENNLISLGSVIEGDPYLLRTSGICRDREVEIVLFYVDGCATNKEVEKEYGNRSLRRVHPSALIELNREDPEFADLHKNVTYWPDYRGDWRFIIFDRHFGPRRVSVSHNRFFPGAWLNCWFGGVRIENKPTA